jgi:hypothetical protein
MTAAELKPFIDLLTWQVVAVFGGAALLPAVYLVAWRLNEIQIGDVTGRLTAKMAQQAEKEAENDVEAALEEGRTATQALQEAASAEEASTTPQERYKTGMKVWSALSVAIKDQAEAAGFKDLALTQTSAQVEYLVQRQFSWPVGDNWGDRFSCHGSSLKR